MKTCPKLIKSAAWALTIVICCPCLSLAADVKSAHTASDWLMPQTSSGSKQDQKPQKDKEKESQDGISEAVKFANEQMYKESMEQGAKHILALDFAKAINDFEKALKAKPGDKKAEMMLNRAKVFLEHKDSPGVVVLKVSPATGSTVHVDATKKKFEVPVPENGETILLGLPLETPITISVSKTGFKTHKLPTISLKPKHLVDILSDGIKLDPSVASLKIKTDVPGVKIEAKPESGEPVTGQTGSDATATLNDLATEVPYAVVLSKEGYKTETLRITIPQSQQGGTYSPEPVKLQPIAGMMADNLVLPPNKDPNTNITIRLSLSQNDAKPGDAISVYFEASSDAYLTVLNVGTAGQVVRLWPNDYTDGSNLVKANTKAQFPGLNDKFKYRVQGPAGTDKIVAYATSQVGKIIQESDFASVGKSAFKSYKGRAKDLSIRFRNEANQLNPSVKWGSAQTELRVSQ